MKIIYISNSRIPTEKAYGIQVMQTCSAFALHGVGLELVLPTRKNHLFKDIDPFKYYQVKNNFKIKKIVSFDPRFLIKFPQGTYIKFQFLFLMFSLFFHFLFKKNKSEYIFYTRDEYLLPLLQLFSKKVVWEAHTLPKHRKYYLNFWKKCFRIITISQGLKNELIADGLDSSEILVAPDGVNLDKNKGYILDKDKQEIYSVNKNIILYTGHLYQWKGVDVLAEASKHLVDNSLVVFLGGTENDTKKFKEKHNGLIKEKKVLVLGYKKPVEVLTYLKTADILVLPNSKKDVKSKWTSPLKMFEYMAANHPIVAADLDSIKEILSDQEAMFFKTDDAIDLAAKINLLINDKELGNRIAEQAQQKVQNYTWLKRTEKILEFLNK